MTLEQFELYYILRNREMPFEERVDAALSIFREATYRKIEATDIVWFYQVMVEFWRSLGATKTDREDKRLFETRKRLASFCWRLSLQLPEGQKFFRYYPGVKRAEGYDDRFMNRLVTGALKPGYGTSLYEFHLEYPIEGIGIRKDGISVITDDDQKIPMLDWCRQNDIIVFCNRCGLDITYEVSRECPYRKWL